MNILDKPVCKLRNTVIFSCDKSIYQPLSEVDGLETLTCENSDQKIDLRKLVLSVIAIRVRLFVVKDRINEANILWLGI